MRVLVKFSERLSELMFQANVTPEELSGKLNIAASTIRCWKNGSRSIQLSYAVQLADYFNCSLEFLCGRSDTVIDFAVQPSKQFYEALMSHMKSSGISRYKIVKETQFSNGNFDSWRKGGDPKIQTVIDLADYLEITLDRLLGRDK